ncbi:hypothetical protein MASR2M117_05140 [Paludibacter sp.]
MKEVVKIKSIEFMTHDVINLHLSKPANFVYLPGDGAELAINQDGWNDKFRPFTFTSLPEEDVLEFNIKSYTDHEGVTNKLATLKAGEELILDGPFETVRYKGEGVFIAGGTGITPFKALLKELHRDGKLGNNKLIFANKTSADIIWKNEFEAMLGKSFINVLSGEENPAYEHGYVTADLIKKVMTPSTEYFYLCGPSPMIKAVKAALLEMGIDASKIIRA